MPTTTEVSDGLLDYEGAAAYLAISPRQVRELWVQRKVTVVKIGRAVRFRRRDLDEYVNGHTVPAVHR
jgi:excisionase family DNA binding protein